MQLWKKHTGEQTCIHCTIFCWHQQFTQERPLHHWSRRVGDWWYNWYDACGWWFLIATADSMRGVCLHFYAKHLHGLSICVEGSIYVMGLIFSQIINKLWATRCFFYFRGLVSLHKTQPLHITKLRYSEGDFTDLRKSSEAWKRQTNEQHSVLSKIQLRFTQHFFFWGGGVIFYEDISNISGQITKASQQYFAKNGRKYPYIYAWGHTNSKKS